ncbi:hypothetical protein [Mycobacterium paraterrae]|uniref:Uncharacterized protein n=1 Tax=Mycobacterium paraterrae TaxID=577492 RepID=A0ABY3VQN6_9MYCO|nr:hypothetical protein [Mycobacterium paraterrae]UMB71761.1 hypothetical protein MKK62_11355 [Mycobacterium paraterrae]
MRELIATGSPGVTQSSGATIPQWLVDLGPLGLSAVVGGVVVAALNHFLTSRREHRKWMRELQADTNQKFYEAISTVTDLVGHDVSKAIHFGKDEILQDCSELMADHLVKLGNAFAALMVVAEANIKTCAETIMETLPDLALLAIPRPAHVNEASKNQLAAMLDARTGLAAHILLVMRREAGLVGWAQWRLRMELRTGKALRLAKIRTKLALDLTEEDEPGGPPTPFGLLEWWKVRALASSELPSSVQDYRSTNNPYRVDIKGIAPLPLPQSQAVLIKTVDSPWRFGLADGLSAILEDRLMADACRIVTGHGVVFPPKLRPQHEPLVSGLDVWVWAGVEDGTSERLK